MKIVKEKTNFTKIKLPSKQSQSIFFFLFGFSSHFDFFLSDLRDIVGIIIIIFYVLQNLHIIFHFMFLYINTLNAKEKYCGEWCCTTQ